MRAVKLLRVVLGIGQQELATAAHLSVRELARIETGQTRPAPATMANLDVAFLAILDRRLRRAA
jgi:transcriptional regulator with XRE-family HTH domain